jgi:hypothetical protein
MKPIPEPGPALDAEEEALFAAIADGHHVPVSVMKADDLHRFREYAKLTWKIKRQLPPTT